MDREMLHKMEGRRSAEFFAFPQEEVPFDVLHYGIDITVDIPNDTIWATVDVTVLSLSDTLSTLRLHFVGLTVESVLVNGSPASFSRPDSFLLVDLGGVIPSGDTFVVTVNYHGLPTTGGGVFGGGLTIEPGIAYVDVEPYGAKRWIPCNDNPADKALSDLIVTVPVGYDVVGNGVLVDSTLGSNWWTFHWRESYPIATYLLVFAARDFVHIVDTFNYGTYSMPVIHWVIPPDSLNAVSEFAHTTDMLEFFSDTFGLYPFINEKYAHVEIPIWGAMEDQTNTFYGFPIIGGQGHDWVIAHELAHQWWGDAVTLGTWADIWLNEGFATYCEALYIGHRDGGNAYHDYVVENILNYYINHEPYPPFPIYNPPSLFTTVSYEKGAAVLHMLRRIVGDSLFFAILREYYDLYGYGNAVTEDFINVCESVSGQDLDWFFEEWVYLPGHPVYHYSWNYETVTPDSYNIFLNINQVQDHNLGIPTYIMPVDIGIVLSTGDTALFTVWDSLDEQSFVLSTDETPVDLLFDPYDWILKEAQETSIFEGDEERTVYLSLKPNPFGRKLDIKLVIEEIGPFSLSIYSINGMRVKTLREEIYPGAYEFSWFGGDEMGRRVRRGIYFITLLKGKRVIERRRVLYMP
jgi:aminopeptidase N